MDMENARPVVAAGGAVAAGCVAVMRVNLSMGTRLESTRKCRL